MHPGIVNPLSNVFEFFSIQLPKQMSELLQFQPDGLRSSIRELMGPNLIYNTHAVNVFNPDIEEFKWYLPIPLSYITYLFFVGAPSQFLFFLSDLAYFHSSKILTL